MQELAKVFFETIIELVPGQIETNKLGGDKVVFRIKFKAISTSDTDAGGGGGGVRGVNPKRQRANLAALTAANRRLPERLLAQFPWHIVISSEMKIVHCGASMLRRFGRRIMPPTDQFVSFDEACTTIRPAFDTKVVTYDDLLQHTRVPFIISVLGLPIQGQMVPLQESLIFLASPYANSLDGLTELGLTMADLPLHDSRREMILATETRNAEMELTKSLDTGADRLMGVIVAAFLS